MKKLTQAIFNGSPKWVKSSAINKDGEVYWYNVTKEQLSQTGSEHVIKTWITRHAKFVGIIKNTTDWQNSAIDREVLK